MTIIREGERGEDCFILESGEVEVLQGSATGTRRVALLGPGSIFGEAALLSDVRRNATVKTTRPTVLYSIAGNLLSKIISTDRGLSNLFFELFSLRDLPRRAAGILSQPGNESGNPALTILKNPKNGSYYRLSAEGVFVWEQLDGNNNLRDLTLKYFERFRAFAPFAIAGIIAGLTRGGFVESRAAHALATGQWDKAKGWRRWARWAGKILEWRVMIRNVDRPLTLLYQRGVRHLFTRPVQIFLGLVAASGLVLFFLLGTRTQSPMAGSTGMATTYFYLIPAFLVSAFFHEAGHAFTTKAFGREVGSVGFGWYWFGPIFYVDTSDMWLAPKWPRIAVSAAGAYADLITAAVASIIGYLVSDPAISHLFWVFALASYVVVLVNLNPLMEYDGYYVLSDLLGKPNLRRNALDWFKREFPGALFHPRKIGGHLPEMFYVLSSLLYIVFMTFQAVWLYRTILNQLR